MTSPKNQNSADSSVKDSLEAGLAALKARDYDRAIALLESTAETAANQPLGVRAQMGLVAAYKATGNLKGSIALCTSLTKNPHSQVKTWADRTLKELIDRRPPKPPENPGKIAEITPALPNPQTPPETGFVAFDSETESSKPPADNQGFLPFEPTVGQNKGKSKDISRLPAPPKPPSFKSSKLEKSTDTGFDPEITEISDENSAGSPTDIPLFINSDTYELTWRQAGRAKGWKALKPLKLNGFRLEAIASIIALFFVARFVLQFLMTTANNVLLQVYIFSRLPFFKPIQLFYRDSTLFVYTVFLLLLVSSPWLIDLLLKLFCGIQPLKATALLTHSKEANRVIRNFCNKKNLPPPILKVLPINVPVAFSYGCLPRFARIVVSQGLLEQLTEDEIATILARELGHISHWDFAPMSLAMLVIQIPYLIYWQVAYWGDRLSGLMTIAFMRSTVTILAGTISAASYGIYKLFRWPMLWLSRRRVYFSDRAAAEITGNPNGLTRALAKMAIGMASCVEEQKQTSFFLEGFDLLLPVGVGQAVTLGSAALHSPLEQILLWDVSNPYRNWLTVNNTHPLMGERLKLLALYAQFWKIETELDLADVGTTEKSTKRKFPWAGMGTPPLRLLLQGAPFFGIPMSLAIVGVLWTIGGIVYYLTYIWQLDWLLGDRSLLWGCLPIGFSIGTLIRINYFFPDIKPGKMPPPSLPEILSNSETLPLDATPVKLEGKLLGRSNLDNWLGQDLILQTATGLVKLHYVSRVGPIGSLLPFLSKETTHPGDLVGKSVVATGWLRRGATVAIDLESLRSQSGQVSNSGHPIWSAILAFAAAIWGAYIIIQGGR
ncbi:MAG: M48 family metalloprotease [Microcoleus sp. CSU_2_2]|nr:M48 family metalloprotease [Microcoleus sp. CSU_2_2]